MKGRTFCGRENSGENVDTPQKKIDPAESAAGSDAKSCLFCGGSGKADYLVHNGLKTMLEECFCHICAGTGNLSAEMFRVINGQLNELREQAVESGRIRDNCPTCRGYGYAFTRNKAFGATSVFQIKCLSCMGRKLTYSKRDNSCVAEVVKYGDEKMSFLRNGKSGQYFVL